jgi:hypothetical protein
MAIEKKAKENIRENGKCNSEGHPKADIYIYG